MHGLRKNTSSQGVACTRQGKTSGSRMPQLDKNTACFPAEVVFRKHRWWLVCLFGPRARAHALVNLVTALVPSDTACLASSPGRIRRTDV